MSVLDDLSKGIKDEMASYVNQFMFPLYEESTVGFKDNWIVVRHGDEKYERSQLKDLKMQNGIFHATRVDTSYVPNATAVAELQALVDKWKERGWDNFAETVTTRDYSDEYDSWTDNVFDDLTDKQVTEVPIVMHNPVFVEYVAKPMEFNPQGLTIPLSNARITNLTLEGLGIDNNNI